MQVDQMLEVVKGAEVVGRLQLTGRNDYLSGIERSTRTSVLAHGSNRIPQHPIVGSFGTASVLLVKPKVVSAMIAARNDNATAEFPAKIEYTDRVGTSPVAQAAFRKPAREDVTLRLRPLAEALKAG